MINDKDFKDLIIPALQDCLDGYNPPTTKRVYKESSSISYMGIDDILNLMEVNNIPKNATIISHNDNPAFEWEEVEPITEEEKKEIRKNVFNGYRAFEVVNKVLTQNGYKRIPVWSNEFKPFKGTTVYDMFVNREFDRLHKYYSLFFDKE